MRNFPLRNNPRTEFPPPPLYTRSFCKTVVQEAAEAEAEAEVLVWGAGPCAGASLPLFFRFTVYITVPMYSEGVAEGKVLQAILFWQAETFRMMYKLVADAIAKWGPEGAHPTDYLMVFFPGYAPAPEGGGGAGREAEAPGGRGGHREGGGGAGREGGAPGGRV